MLKQFLCKLLECSKTLCEFIVGEVFVVSATRESYCGRLLISRNFGVCSEIVSVVS